MQTGGELVDLVLGANTVGAGVTVTGTGVYTGTGAADGLINVVANSLTTGDGSKMSFTGLSSGTGLEIIGGTAMTTNGELLDLNMGAATAGNGINIATTGIYTGTGLSVITANSATTGIGQSISMTGLTTGSAFRATGSGATMQTGGELVDLVLGANTVGAGVTITSTGAYTGVGTADGLLNITANSLTSGYASQIFANGITTGRGLNLSSTSTALTTGNLGYIEWAPGSTATATTADLFRINIGTNGTISGGNLFNVTDTGSSLFSVSETAITSALPHSFTTAGDVSVAYDMIFTNQTSSYIKSNAPLYIQTGESFENNNLTLQMYGTGQAITELGTGYALINSTSTSVDGATATNLNVAGQYINTSDLDTISLLVRNNNTGTITMTNVGTAGAQGDPGVLTVEGAGGTTTVYNLITAYNSLTRSDAAAVFRVRADGNVYGEAAFNATGADLAEYFAKEESIPDGAIAGMNKETGKVRQYRNGDTVIGIVTSSPAFIGNRPSDKSDEEIANEYALIGLNGQIRVKVASENGDIKIGDHIAFSTVNSGIGVKSIKAGPIVGKALENYSSTNPSETGTILAYVSPQWYAPDAMSLQINDLGQVTYTYSDQQLNAKFEAIDRTIGLNTIETSNNILAGFEATLDSKLASISAQLAALQVQPTNTFDEATISGQLRVLGTSNLGETNIAGKLTVGLLSVDDITATLSSLTGTITAEGNLVVKQTVTAQKYNVDTSDVLGASVGKTVIPIGLTELTIDTSAVSTASSIFVTPEIPISIAASATDSGRFTIKIPSSLTEPLKVNWWVIN